MLKEKTGFDSSALFLDIGSGLAKPNFHVAVDPGVRLSLGVEVQGGRWWQSMTLLDSLLDTPEVVDQSRNVYLCHANVLEMQSFYPATHIYCFNKGMPPHVMERIAKLFHQTDSAKYFICFNKPAKLEEYGFDLNLLDRSVSGTMYGSHRKHLCYVYETAAQSDSSSHEAPTVSSTDLSHWGTIPPPKH